MSFPRTDALNEMSPVAFANALAPLFEGAPRFLARLTSERPFSSDQELLEVARRVARGAPEDDLIELLDAHPRIGADPVAMSPFSRAEQDDGAVVAASLARELTALNDAYEKRFGFRYVVFVAGRPRAAILPLMRDALASDRGAELQRAVGDVLAIAADRLRRERAPLEDAQEATR